MRRSMIKHALAVTALAALAAGIAWQATVSPCTETAGPTRALGLFKPGTPVSLEDGFLDPPPISRAQCWWQCFGSAFTREEITRELEEFRAKGMGGVTIKDTLLMPRDEKTAHIKDITYMSPEWLDMFAHIVAECKRLGMICRSRLGSGWNEGGPWVPSPQSSQILAFAKSKPITGPARYAGPIPEDGGAPTAQALQSGEAFVVAMSAAGRKGVDLTAKVSGGRNLTWDVPAGTWTLVSCFSTSSGITTMSSSPSGTGLHHDHLNTAAADLHLERVGGRMLAKIGPFEKTAFDGFNSDSWELGNPTWTPGFRAIFRERRGYDPVPYLPLLAEVTEIGTHALRGSKLSPQMGEEGRRFLFDFRTTVSDLIVERFYAHVDRWCRARGVAYEAEAGGPVHVPKDLLQAQGAVSIPMGEFWASPWAVVKVPSSAAHAYGKRLVGMESMTNTSLSATRNHLSDSPAAMKKFFDNAFLLGGNYITMAVVEYSPVEAGLPGWVHNCGPHLNHNQTWWPMARAFFDYLGRCSFLLQSGRNVAQVALYHTFRTGEDGRWDEGSNDLSKWPKEFAFDYVGDDLVQNHMRVRDGRVVLTSGATYPVLCIMPTPRATMPLATLLKIRDLTRQGAKVVWLSKPEARCPGLTDQPRCDATFRGTLKEMEAAGQFAMLPTPDLAALVPIVERSADPPAWLATGDVPLRFVHRRTAEADIFFVVNRGDKPVDTPVTFRIQNRRPEFWDPESGRREPAVWQKADGGVRMNIALPADGVTFVVFRATGGVPPSERKVAAQAPAHVAINGPWEVEFQAGRGAPPKVTLPALRSWTEESEPGIRYFSGIATYRATFRHAPLGTGRGARAVLDLGRVAEVCEVRVNGKLAGTAWHPPYRLDVTQHLVPGTNHLEIRVANLWPNRLIGDAGLPKGQRITRTAHESFYEKARGWKLLESGLLGPVRIEFGRGR